MPTNDPEASNAGLPSFVTGSDDDGSGMDIRAVLGVLLRHWKLIVVIPLLTLGATYGALKLVRPLYKSTVEVLVVDPKLQADSGINRQLSYLEVDNAAISNEITLIESKSAALRVAKELGLDKDQEFQRLGRLEIWAQKLGLSHPGGSEGERASDQGDRGSPRLLRAAATLQNRLKVERVQNSYVLAISMTSEDPAKAELLARTIADDYLKEQADARADAMRRTADWLSGRLQELRTRVLETQEVMQKLKAQGGLSDVGIGSNVNQQQTSDLNTQLMQARSDLGEKRARYDQARQIVDSGGNIQEIPDVMSSNLITQLRLQQSELSRKEAELLSQFGERFPEVVAVRSQQDDIRKAISAEVARVLGNMKNSYEAAARREQSLEAGLQKLTSAHADSEAYARLRDLQPVADADRKAYETFLAQYNEISQRATQHDIGARIVTPASFPEEPSSPRPLIIYAFAGALSIAGALAIAMLMEFLDSGFKTGTQVERAFGYHVIGMIPLVRPKRFHRASKGFAMARDIAEAPLSRLSEAVRTTRMGLGLRKATGAARAVLVTSSVPNEGKSTTATLLATSSALSGNKTVLLDCDFRHKTVSKSFGENHQGLSDVIMGRAEIAAVTRRDDTTGLYVIPAGSCLWDVPDLVNSQRILNLFEQLRSQYDCVVLDASPLLAVIDAVALAALVDKVLMVVEWSRTPRSAVVEALKVLRPEAHRIAGFVLTKVDLKRLRKYGYGYGHGYNYGNYYRAVDKYFSGP